MLQRDSIMNRVGGRPAVTTTRDFFFRLAPGTAKSFPQAELIPDFQATCDWSFIVFALPTKTATHRFTLEISTWVRGDSLITALGPGHSDATYYERTECRQTADKRICRDL